MRDRVYLDNNATTRPLDSVVEATIPFLRAEYANPSSVHRFGQEVRHKVIEVNSPLNYSGYQFIQSGYDEEHHRYTVLGVTSNSGLGLVYAGFVLMGVGVLWWFWLRPALSHLNRRRADGD